MYRNIKKTGIFIWTTLFVSWLFAAVIYTLGVRWNTAAAMVAGVVYMFIPMTVAIIVQKRVFHNLVRGPLGISFSLNRWFLVAWLLPPLVAFAALGISLLFPGVEYSPGMEGLLDRFAGQMTPEQMELARTRIDALPVHPVLLLIIPGLITGITVNVASVESESPVGSVAMNVMVSLPFHSESGTAIVTMRSVQSTCKS